MLIDAWLTNTTFIILLIILTCQKEQLRRCVIDCTVRHLTFADMQQYIKEKLQIDISTDYLRHVRSSLRQIRLHRQVIFQAYCRVTKQSGYIEKYNCK